MSPSINKNEIQYLDDKADSVQVSKPHQIVQIDNFQVLGLDPEDADFYINYPEEKKKRVIRKVWHTTHRTSSDHTDSSQVDIRLVPMLAVLYLISHINRANIGVSSTLHTLLVHRSCRTECKNRRHGRGSWP